MKKKTKQIFENLYSYIETDIFYNNQGITDSNDTILVEPKYYTITPYNKDFAIVSKVPSDYLRTNNIFYGIIDKNLQEIVSPDKLKYSGERAYFLLIEEINKGTFNTKTTINCIKNNSIETPNNTKPCDNEFIVEIDNIFMKDNKFYMLCPKCGYIIEVPNEKLTIEDKKYLINKFDGDTITFRKMELFSELVALSNIKKKQELDPIIYKAKSRI